MDATRVRTRARASARRRDAILRAALHCFVQKGYATTTMEDIRLRCGASIGSIYHHFDGKEELAGTLYVEGLRRYQAGFLAELRRHRDPRGGVHAMVDYHLHWISENANWARYLFLMREAESVAVKEQEIRDMNTGLLLELDAWLQPHRNSVAIGRVTPDMLIPILLGPAQSFARQWLSGRAATTIAEARRILADAAWRALATSEKPAPDKR